MPRPSLAACLLALAIPALAAPPPGEYRGDDLRVELAGEGGELSGSISFRGRTYEATARLRGERLVGRFDAGGKAFDFELVEQNGSYVFRSGGRDYPVALQDSDNPFAEGPDAANPFAAEPEGSDADAADAATDFADQLDKRASSAGQGEAWRTYRHPSGFQFRHPANWRIEANEFGVLLTPPNQATSPQGPTEVYLAVAEQAGGATRPDEPEVLAYINESVYQMLPFLRQVGRPEPVRDATHPSVVLTYEGRSPTGLDTRARAWVTIFQGWGVMFLAAGEKPTIERRDDAFGQLFVSISKEAPEVDPALVGLWKFSETYISGDFGGTYSRTMALRGDGRAFAGSRVMASLVQNSHDGIGALGDNVSADTGDKAFDDRGEWHADPRQRILTINWSDGGSERWRYYVEGSSLLLKRADDQSKRQVWRRGQ